MTLLEAGPSVGGLVAGWKTKGGKSIEAGGWVDGLIGKDRSIPHTAAADADDGMTPLTLTNRHIPTPKFTKRRARVLVPVPQHLQAGGGGAAGAALHGLVPLGPVLPQRPRGHLPHLPGRQVQTH